MSADITAKDTARFWRKVEKRGLDDCWNWQAGKKGSGYGCFDFQSNSVAAHRFSYLMHHGRIPEGMCVMHKCDNRSCVNPAHLSLGTHAENMADMKLKGRGKGPSKEKHWCHLHPERRLRGDNHPARRNPHIIKRGIFHSQAKLTEDQVRSIRGDLARGVTGVLLAKRMGVSTSVISCIRKGKTWRCVA